MRELLGRLAATALVVGMLTSCSSDPPAIKRGACLAGETTTGGERAPDVTSVVPCTSPHRYEVYDVIDLPPREVAAGEAQERCATSLLRATGYDVVKVNGKAAAAAGLIPALRGIEAPRYVVMPEQPWKSDSREVACAARMTAPARSANDNVQLLSIAGTSDFPVSLRPCRAYDAERRSIADHPCTERHASELLFFFEADQAMGKRFTASIVRAPTAAKFDRLDDACTSALPYLLGSGYDKRLRGFGSVAQRWTDSRTTVRCEVGPRAFRTADLPAGSLVGTEAKRVKLLPAP